MGIKSKSWGSRVCFDSSTLFFVFKQKNMLVTGKKIHTIAKFACIKAWIINITIVVTTLVQIKQGLKTL